MQIASKDQEHGRKGNERENTSIPSRRLCNFSVKVCTLTTLSNTICWTGHEIKAPCHSPGAHTARRGNVSVGRMLTEPWRHFPGFPFIPNSVQNTMAPPQISNILAPSSLTQWSVERRERSYHLDIWNQRIFKILNCCLFIMAVTHHVFQTNLRLTEAPQPLPRECWD